MFFASEIRMTRRLRNGWVKRYRACLREECKHRWYTYEIPAARVADTANPDGLKEIPK